MKEKQFLFYAVDGAGAGATEGVEVELNTQAQQAGQIQRSTKPKAPDINVFSVIKGMKYVDIAKIITSHLKSSNKEPYKDRQAEANGFTRYLKSFWLADKSAFAFKGTPWYDKVPPAIKDWTIETLIEQQFAWSTHVAKSEWLAEFINVKIPIANGYARVRLFQYNRDGFVTGEYREYTNITVSDTLLSNAVERREKVEITPQQYEMVSEEELKVEDPKTPPAQAKKGTV